MRTETARFWGFQPSAGFPEGSPAISAACRTAPAELILRAQIAGKRNSYCYESGILQLATTTVRGHPRSAVLVLWRFASAGFLRAFIRGAGAARFFGVDCKPWNGKSVPALQAT